MDNQKNSNYLFKTKREWVKYRWEFMRRDPDFIPAFDNVLRLNNLYNDGKVPEEMLDEAVRKFSKEFEIPQPVCLIDRKKSFDEIELEKGKDSLTICFMYRYFGQAISIITGFGDNPNPGKPNLVPKDHLVLDIDLSKVNSITALRELVIWHIDSYWKEYFLPKHPDRPKPKRIRDFDKIIEVGDLKKKEKRISWNELAKRCFSDDPDPDSRKKRAIQHYARYEELINGGWRDFRFP